MKTEYNNIKIIGGTWEDKGSDSNLFYNRYDKFSREKIVDKFLKGFSGNNILDLGCSIGAWGDFFRRHRIKNINGVDISKERLKIAEKRGYKTFCCNAKKTPFDDKSFDLIMSIDMLVHTIQKKDRDVVYKEIKRILQPEGLLILSIPNAKAFGYIPNTIVEYCCFIGIKEIKEAFKGSDMIIEDIVGKEYFQNNIFVKALLKILPRIGYGIIMPFLDVIGKKFLGINKARIIFFKIKKMN